MYYHSPQLDDQVRRRPEGSGLERDFRQSLVPPGTDPRPRIVNLPRSPRPPPQDSHSSDEPNDETHEHGNAIHHPVLGIGFYFYPLGQGDSNRSVIVPAFFPEFREGSVDINGR